MDSTGNIDTATPNTARIYDYWLGGKDNYEADRRAAESLTAVYPAARSAARANRLFHQRAAAWMARQGIGQFLDIGCGLPTVENTHEAVRRAVPGARVAYVDSDPVVVSHARGLLANGNEGVTATAGDARDPEAVVRDPAVRGVLRYGEPVGLLITGVLHFISDRDNPSSLVGRYMAGLAPGSCVALSHAAADNLDEVVTDAAVDIYAKSDNPAHLRTRTQVRAMLAGLELIAPHLGGEPDVVAAGAWMGDDLPAPASGVDAGEDAYWAAVARRTS
jgi:trans-aconitate methyltransferase